MECRKSSSLKNRVEPLHQLQRPDVYDESQGAARNLGREENWSDPRYPPPCRSPQKSVLVS